MEKCSRTDDKEKEVTEEMDNAHLKKLLAEVAAGTVSPAEAEKALQMLPFEDLDCVNIDNHRSLRTGYPEVVFCQGKTCEQVGIIMARLSLSNNAILGTRATREQYDEVCRRLDGGGAADAEAVYHQAARMIVVQRPLDEEEIAAIRKRRTIAVVTAGTADIPVAEEAAITAETLGNVVERVYDVGVAGIHRLFAKLEIIRAANVVIVVAGMEGALASVVGGLIDKPVIAVPTSIGYGANLGGLSALLSMLNSCANGVGIVNIDNGFGAGYLASSINRINTEG